MKKTGTRQGGKTKKAAKARKPAGATTAAEEAFRRASVVRGDAVRTKDGKLPPGATFEIEGVDEAGTPVIKRKRFSIT